ncbi:hypothetical protein [Cupriavidus sp. Marseille-Q8015]
MNKNTEHSRLAYLLWRDRVWQDEVGQQFSNLCLLSRIRRRLLGIWRSTHWSVTGIYTATLAFVVALATSWISGKNNDLPGVNHMKETNAGVVLLECVPDVGEFLKCRAAGRKQDHHSIAGPENRAAAHNDLQQQPPAQEK